jgi:hypothetical protein
MNYFRIRCTMATRMMGEQLGPEHDYTDALYVMAPSAQGARARAMATWPDIRNVLNIQQVCG